MKIVRIGVPPGLGDIYWTLTKLQDYRRRHEVDQLHLVIYKKNINERSGVVHRSKDIHELVDFVDAAFYADYNPSKNGHIRHRINGSTMDIEVMWANSHLESGKHLIDFMPEYRTSFDFRINGTKPHDNLVRRTLIYPSASGVNRAWTNRTPRWWASLIRRAYVRDEEPTVVIGAQWDMDYWEQIRDGLDEGSYIDMVGKTTLAEVCGLIERASLLIGVISGMTIMANHYRTRCLAIYPNQFCPEFPYTWVVAGQREYTALNANNLRQPDGVLDIAQALPGS